MCRRKMIVIKDAARKMKFERLFVDAQLACDKAGGNVPKRAMKEMSLEHFFAICALNHIDITFTPFGDYKK